MRLIEPDIPLGLDLNGYKELLNNGGVHPHDVSNSVVRLSQSLHERRCIMEAEPKSGVIAALSETKGMIIMGERTQEELFQEDWLTLSPAEQEAATNKAIEALPRR